MSESSTAGEQAPGEIDTSRPHPARMYNYYLGGYDNYEVDREAAERMIAIAPEAPYAARANRAFMHRAVRCAAESGIRQFLDLGTGIPIPPNPHDTAREVAPDARVVYVDNDPIVATHAGARLTNASGTGFLLGDLRDPGTVLGHPLLAELIDFDRPVALMLVAVLHFVADEDDPAALVAAFTDRLAKGSCVILSHATSDFHGRDREERAEQVYAKATASLHIRDREALLPFFQGFEFAEPGLVQAPLWRPDGEVAAEELARVPFYAGVAFKN
jgi:hypothetical protein